MAKPPCKGRRPATNDPVALLAQAQQHMFDMMTGQHVIRVETPQLGSVEYASPSLADMQWYIDYLAMQAGIRRARIPFSIVEKP